MGPGSRGYGNDVRIGAHTLGGKRWILIGTALGGQVVNRERFPVHIPKLTQPLEECLEAWRRRLRRTWIECMKAEPRPLRGLLSSRGDRPRRRAAENSDEVPPPHSINLIGAGVALVRRSRSSNCGTDPMPLALESAKIALWVNRRDHCRRGSLSRDHQHSIGVVNGLRLRVILSRMGSFRRHRRRQITTASTRPACGSLLFLIRRPTSGSTGW